MQIIIDSEDIISLVNHYVKINTMITEEDLSDYLNVIEEWITEPQLDLVDLEIEEPNDLIPVQLETKYWSEDFINRIKRNN